MPSAALADRTGDDRRRPEPETLGTRLTGENVGPRERVGDGIPVDLGASVRHAQTVERRVVVLVATEVQREQLGNGLAFGASHPVVDVLVALTFVLIRGFSPGSTALLPAPGSSTTADDGPNGSWHR
jgi:hypothetical protein